MKTPILSFCSHRQTRSLFSLALLLGFLAVRLPWTASAAETAVDAKAKEQELLKVLKSDAPDGDKAVVCKKLAIYGSEKAVPALAALLTDERFNSWARTALEAIPGPAADKALRDAAGKLQGRPLAGVLNSIGVRRDSHAVTMLAAHLKDNDAQVASAAAVALGKIGGTKAARILTKALAQAPAEVRTAVAQGCVRCAEQFLAEGKTAAAVKLYDTTRAGNVPLQQMLEATRGAILARNTAGLPLLLEQLHSSERERFRLGLRVARELPGTQVTQALNAELPRTPENRQPLLLLALADRGDSLVIPTLVAAAQTGPKACRLVAVSALEKADSVVALPTLLHCATDSDPDVAHAALAAASRLPAKEVDSQLVAQLPRSSGKMREVLITVASRRGVTEALPVIVTFSKDSSPEVRAAAMQAIGALGGSKEAAALVGLLQQDSKPAERTDMETALVSLSGRLGNNCAQPVMPLAQSSDPALRVIALHALAAAGGSDALNAVVAATTDSDENVRGEAVRTLSSWPNTWPEDANIAAPLLKLAQTEGNSSYQVLAQRGYLQFLRGDKNLKREERAAKLESVLPLLQRPEEKRSAIAMMNEVPGSAALRMLLPLATDSTVGDDACEALIKLASNTKAGLPDEDRQKALQTALEKCSQDSVKKKAETELKKLTKA